MSVRCGAAAIDNLGGYAVLLCRMGQSEAAPEMFEKALRRNSRHRKVTSGR